LLQAFSTRERAHHERDNNRIVRSFGGLEFVSDHVDGNDPRQLLRDHIEQALVCSGVSILWLFVEKYYTAAARPLEVVSFLSNHPLKLSYSAAVRFCDFHLHLPTSHLAPKRFVLTSPATRKGSQRGSPCFSNSVSWP